MRQKFNIIIYLSLLFVLISSISSWSGAFIHTVMTGEVVRLELHKNRFVIERSGTGARRYIIVNKSTKVYYEGKEDRPPTYFSWSLIKKGMLLRAEGGLTLEAKIKASKIVILKKH